MSSGKKQLATYPGRIYQCKTVMLGESSVGKSSLVLNYVHNVFYDFQEPTIGAAFLCKTQRIKNETVKFEIWDTAGQERYHSLTPMYYRNARAAIVVYDITNGSSFVRGQMWVRDLQHQARNDVIIALIGNKSDLEDDRVIEYDEAEMYAKEKNILFLETSAKTGINVETIFTKIGENLLAKGVNQNEIIPPVQEGVQLNQQKFLFKNCCDSS